MLRSRSAFAATFVAVAVALTIGAACDAPTAPLPGGAERFSPPEVYRRWWALTQECSGLAGDFGAVHWYRVPGAASIRGPSGSEVQGTWEQRENRIVLAGEAWLAGDLVRHEMLHALLQQAGHPRAEFVGRCGGVVVCIDACLAEAGAAPPPDAGAVDVDPSALEVRVALEPEVAGEHPISGHFIMWVSVHNPTDQALHVVLPGDSPRRASFAYRLDGEWLRLAYGVPTIAETPEMTRFSAGETKRYAFDFVVNGDLITRYDVTPGIYTFRGGYFGAWSDSTTVATVWP